MKKYTVLQQHFGDKQYWPGDSREVHDADAPELLAMGLIADADGGENGADGGENGADGGENGADGGEKSQQAAPKNKAQTAAPKNKQPVAPPSEGTPDGEDDHA